MWDISLDQCRYGLWAYGGDVTTYGDDDTGATFTGHSQKGPFDEQICLCPGKSSNVYVNISVGIY